MEMLTQLNRAMTYIEEHIADDLALADVSSVTAYSPFHFGRLFYYIADMPLSDYIRKRKLSLAAMALQSSDIKVIDLAVMYGYDSADSFTRAFVKQHGVTPSAARQPGVSLTIFSPLSFQIKIKGVQAMNWRIEERETFEVFGIEMMVVQGNGGVLWEQCFADGSYEKLFDDAGGKLQPNGLGYPREDGACVIGAIAGHCSAYDGYREGEEGLLYMLCAQVQPGVDTSGYTVVQIPKATWAVFRSKTVQWAGGELPGLFEQIYTEWLPISGYDRATGPDMELYYGVPNKQYAEVWVPVTKIESVKES
ncbi:MAG: AraC family transcriptional regulator [Oscillospiraceae bacterium]|nr:AraC family transcriptional regulator [Oscillospiraceae bacterium]